MVDASIKSKDLTPIVDARLLLRAAIDRFHERKGLPLPVRAQHFLAASLALLQDLLQRVQVSVRLRQEVELLVGTGVGAAPAFIRLGNSTVQFGLGRLPP